MSDRVYSAKSCRWTCVVFPGLFDMSNRCKLLIPYNTAIMQMRLCIITNSEAYYKALILGYTLVLCSYQGPTTCSISNFIVNHLKGQDKLYYSYCAVTMGIYIYIYIYIQILCQSTEPKSITMSRVCLSF